MTLIKRLLCLVSMLALTSGCDLSQLTGGDSKKKKSAAQSGDSNDPLATPTPSNPNEGTAPSNNPGDQTAPGPLPSNPGTNQATPGTGPVVLVMDDGFWTDLNAFRQPANKIIAEYSLDCTNAGGNTSSRNYPNTFDPLRNDADFETLINDKITDLAAQTDGPGCRRVPSQTPKIAEGLRSFASTYEPAESWNAKIRSKDPTNEEEIFSRDARAALFGFNGGNHHGTSTAGLIAYQNPGVRMVLVKVGFSIDDASSLPTGTANCFTQDEVDLLGKIEADPRYRDAFIKSPANGETIALTKIVQEHGVTLANLSAGTPPADSLEVALSTGAYAHCERLELNEAFGALNANDQARRQYHFDNNRYYFPSVLWVQAGGNEGVEVNTIQDFTDCHDPMRNHVTVGALTHAASRATFSNYGNCITYSTLGADMILPVPLNYLGVGDGTSFASPLVVRYLSINAPANATPQQMKQMLDSAASNGQLLNIYPKELAYRDGNSAFNSFSLTSRLPIQLKNSRSSHQRSLQKLLQRLPRFH